MFFDIKDLLLSAVCLWVVVLCCRLFAVVGY